MGKYSNLRFFNGVSHELNFNYDSTTEKWDGIIFVPKVSVGLYETVNLFVLEEVRKELGGFEYITPIAESSVATKFLFEIEDNESFKGDIFLYDVTDDNGYYTVNAISKQSESILASTTSTLTYNYVNTNNTNSATNQGNVYKQIGTVPSNVALHCKIALMSNEEKIHIKLLNIYDTDSAGNKINLIGTIKIYGETVGEDERLTTLLSNFGMSLQEEDFLIFKNTDINEFKVDYQIINDKRKELLLEAHNIKPFVGTYKAIINAIKFFGYDNIKLKEYWLNINEQSENFGKLKAVAVPDPSQPGYLAKKNNDIQLPNSNLKKTSRFSLVYKLNEPDGKVDEWDVPTVKESFDFTPEEILVKLYGLKRRLQKDYLPLQAKIVDITGEGDFFTQFTQNVWRDQHTIQVQSSGTEVDFTVSPTRRLFIEDLRLISLDLADHYENTINQWPIANQSSVITEVEEFYNNYYNQAQDTYTTLTPVPIGCPVILECTSLTDTWNSCDFNWNDVDLAANDYTGVASSLYTWSSLWKKDVYEAEWVINGPRGYTVTLRGPVDIYKKMLVVLPNSGTHEIILNLYDLYNARSYRRKTDIVVHNKAVELYGFYSFKPELDQWNLDESTWDLSGGYFKEPQASYNIMDEMVASWYLTLDRANYPHDTSNGINFSTVTRYEDNSTPTNFAETAGPFIWKNLKKHVWDDGYGITWDSTRIGPDLAASFAFELDQTSGYTNGYPLTIVHTDISSNQDIAESYVIQRTYPTSNTDLQAYIDIQDELNNLDPLVYPIFAKFKFNAILVDVNANGVEDTCNIISAVGREYSSSYDFKDVYFDTSGNGGGILPDSKVNYKAYNPKFNDIVLFDDHANISMLQHITMSYDKTNMPGIVSQTWSIINNTTDETVTYQGQWLTYLFSERGDYTIQLTVTDCNGNINTTKRNMISVVAPINARPRKRPKYQYVAG
jgi:hypothetical protein